MTNRKDALVRLVQTDVLRDGGLLAVAILAVGMALGLLGSPAVATTTTNFMVTLVAVMALGLFSGNSGVLSFGHTAFMALGAQISATLTIAPMLKARLMPDLPAAMATLGVLAAYRAS